MPINARGRSTKQGSRHPLGHVEWSLPLTEKYKGYVRHELPKHCCECAGHHQIARNKTLKYWILAQNQARNTN